MTTNPNEPLADLLTLQEVARVLKVHDTTIRRWAKQGIFDVVELPHRGTRHSYRIHRAVLDKLIKGGSEGEK